MTEPTTDRPTDTIRDAFEAMIAFLTILIGGPMPRAWPDIAAVAARAIGSQARTTEEADRAVAALASFRDLIQRAAEEHNRRTADAGAFTPERIREARERCERATPGPWVHSPPGVDEPHVSTKIGSDSDRVDWIASPRSAPSKRWHDAAFIAHAREDLPAAIAEIERLNRLVVATANADPSWVERCTTQAAEIERLATALQAERAAWHAAHPACDECGDTGFAMPATTPEPCGNGCKPVPALLTPTEEAEIIASAPGQIGPGQTPIGAAARVTEDELAEIERAAKQIRDGNWPPPGAATILLCERTSDLADEVRALRGERDDAQATIERLKRQVDDAENAAMHAQDELAARPAPAADASLEALGRIVRAAWVEVAKKEAKTVPGYVDLWKWLEIPDADTDRKIGEQVVRAVDASRPAAAIERTLNINALARCARAALRIEVPDVVAWEALPEAERVGWRAVVRCILASTTLASRPGLTEEQAREIAEDVATSFNARWSIGLGQGPLKDMADRIEAGVLRASRGETGPAPTGLTSAMHAAQQRRSVPPASAFGEWPDEPRGGLTCPGCYDATGIAQPHDPRATLRAGDPASPFAPGSLAAGSATEDRILDRKRGGK